MLLYLIFRRINRWLPVSTTTCWQPSLMTQVRLSFYFESKNDYIYIIIIIYIYIIIISSLSAILVWMMMLDRSYCSSVSVTCVYIALTELLRHRNWRYLRFLFLPSFWYWAELRFSSSSQFQFAFGVALSPSIIFWVALGSLCKLLSLFHSFTDLWIMAAKFEFEAICSMQSARYILLKGLSLHKECTQLWLEVCPSNMLFIVVMCGYFVYILPILLLRNMSDTFLLFCCLYIGLVL